MYGLCLRLAVVKRVGYFFCFVFCLLVYLVRVKFDNMKIRVLWMYEFISWCNISIVLHRLSVSGGTSIFDMDFDIAIPPNTLQKHVIIYLVTFPNVVSTFTSFKTLHRNKLWKLMIHLPVFPSLNLPQCQLSLSLISPTQFCEQINSFKPCN